MAQVYVAYEESTEGGEVLEGHEDAEYPHYEDEVTTFRVTGVYRKPPINNPYFQAVTVDQSYLSLDKVTVVWQRYVDSDTFSYHSGKAAIIAVVGSMAEAEHEIQLIKKCQHPNAGAFADSEGFSEEFALRERESA